MVETDCLTKIKNKTRMSILTSILHCTKGSSDFKKAVKIKERKIGNEKAKLSLFTEDTIYVKKSNGIYKKKKT